MKTKIKTTLKMKNEVGDKVLGGGWIDKTFNKNLSTKLTS